MRVEPASEGPPDPSALGRVRPRAPGLHPAGGHDGITPIRDGLFFKLPDALPRGRHKLPRDQVQSAQRERLLAAMTELLAAKGYRGFGPAEIATRAGVSLAAFYGCFENKEACIFAGYHRFIEVLLQRITAIDFEGKDGPAIVEALIRTYLLTMQSDLAVARAYQVEIDALGPPARERRRDSLRLFAAFNRELDIRIRGQEATAELPWSAYIGAVYAVRQLASDALDEQAEPDLLALGADLHVWLSDLFRMREQPTTSDA
jgi:AcrR family transcriptional regulator